MLTYSNTTQFNFPLHITIRRRTKAEITVR